MVLSHYKMLEIRFDGKPYCELIKLSQQLHSFWMGGVLLEKLISSELIN